MWGLCYLNWIFFIIGIAIKDYSIVAMCVMLGLQCVCILAQIVIFVLDVKKFKKEEKRLDALLLLKIMELRNSLEDEEKGE